MKSNKPFQGFTLIELAIVIVIIGLVVGALLTGKDLIIAALLRQQTSQIMKINTAIQTFNLKFGGLPGDIPQDKAASYGMFDRSNSGFGSLNNGRIESCNLDYSYKYMSCEAQHFWTDLSFANLIEGDFSRPSFGIPVAISKSNMSRYLPESALLNGAYLTAFTDSNDSSLCARFNVCFALVNVQSIDSGGVYSSQPAISPIMAFSIDQKIDDAKPLTGRVFGGNILPEVLADPVSATPCTQDEDYNAGNAQQKDVPQCIMNFVIK